MSIQEQGSYNRLAAATVRSDRLTQAILAKAFRGELVPQDPSDEPASALIRRIRDQREFAAPRRPPTRPSAE